MSIEAHHTAKAPALTEIDITGLMRKAFDVPREARSQQYMQGVRAILELKLSGNPLPAAPYALGTCQADAYFSGQDEGHTIARAKLAEQVAA